MGLARCPLPAVPEISIEFIEVEEKIGIEIRTNLFGFLDQQPHQLSIHRDFVPEMPPHLIVKMILDC
jgi:hypothetical protein